MDTAPTDTRPPTGRRCRGRSLGARVTAASLIAWALGLLLSFGSVHGTFATFSAETENADSSFAGGWIDPPTGLSIAPAGDGAAVTWTPGTHAVTGQELDGADGGTSGSASCGTYGSVQTWADDTTRSTTDAGSSANAGHWWCYRLISTSGTAWTSSADFTPIQVGLIPLSVVLANGGSHNGQSENLDTITITYNQDVAVSGNVAVHACKKGIITIGSGCNGAPSIGTITGVTVNANNGYTGSSISVSGPTIVIRLANQTGRSNVSGGGPFVGSGTKVTSSVGGATVCTASNCRPSSSGSF